MATTSKSFAHSLGRGIGYTGAAVVHGAVVATRATGQFGADVVTGTKQGYSEHSARLAALRATLPPVTHAIKVTRTKATA